jgi:hypothetical protein
METREKNELNRFPDNATEFIKKVIKKMRYRRKIRRDVQAELTAHFEDALKDSDTVEKREQQARSLITEFGDVKLLAILLRRAKKRCRPLWKKVLLRTAQVVGIIFIYLLICTSPLMIGKPTIKIDYVEWLNESEQAGRDESDNARLYYQKASQLVVEMPEWLAVSTAKWPTDFNDVEMKALTEWLQKNHESINFIRQAADCPHYWNHYQISGEEAENLSQALVPSLMEPLSGYRQVAFVMRHNIRYEAYRGDVEQAMQDCIVLMKYGHDMQGNGFLVEQLVGIAIEAVGLGEGSRILEKVDMPPEVLENAQRNLEKLIKEDKPVISLDLEKVFWYDIIQRFFTDDGTGDGRLLGRGLPYVIGSDWSLLRILLFEYPSRKETLDVIEQYFDQSTKLIMQSPWRLHNEGIDPNTWSANIGKNIMLDLQGSGHFRLNQISWRMKTQRRGLLIVIALSRYKKENGKYPISLKELVEKGYLESMPIDPFSGRPLVYKKTEDDFILYSVGEDFKDDGGEIFRDDRGRLRMWAATGDWVLWPLFDSSS